MHQKINWESRIANYDIVMQLLKDNDFRPTKNYLGENYYHWKWNPNLVIKADIYRFALHLGSRMPFFHTKLTSHGSLDLIRAALEDALKTTPRLFKK